MSLLVGSTVDLADPFAGAKAREADVAQVHLSAPRVWRAPVPRKEPERWRGWDVPVYVHAPYLVNPASVNPEVRARSRTALQAQVRAAAEVGALAVIVHAGHPTGRGTLQDGVAGWVEVMDGWVPEVPVLVENTATGAAGPGRTLEGFTALWAALDTTRVGVCLDTCHAWAAGWDLRTCAADLAAICGGIDLVHANGSKDPYGSGRDRHENLDRSLLPLDQVEHVAMAAGAPVVVETPGGPDGQRADIRALRTLLATR